MLRHWLSSRPDHADDELRRYRENIQVFLSHSKHDDRGEAVAKTIRGWFNEHSPLASFLDVDDMMAGVRVDAVIEDAIRHGVLVAIYTDSYFWQQRTAQHRLAPHTVFTSRPPELATAAVFADVPSDGESVIVHAGSPLGSEERLVCRHTAQRAGLCPERVA